jgi:uncharacterized membrane protein YphA (DoxX/SURF4 family)
VLSTLLRAGLGVLWLVAGALKISDPAGMVRSVRAFRILPEALVHPVAYAVPFVEIALGALLLLGLAVKACAVLSALLLAIYIGAIASAAARGLRIDCGCFSNGGDLAKGAPTRYPTELVRDSLLLAASVLLALLPAGYLTLDRLVFGPPPAPAGPAGGRAGDGAGRALAAGRGNEADTRPGAADRRGDVESDAYPAERPRPGGPLDGSDRTRPGGGARRRRRDG